MSTLQVANVHLESTGNNRIQFVGSNTVTLSTAGAERMRLGSAGQIGIAGENYGTAGALLVSGGAAAAPSWGAFVVNVQEFTSSGSATWTKPAGAAFSQIIVIGGGGSGGTSSGNFSMCSTQQGRGGGGGGAGGAAILWKVASAIGTTETVTVGAAAGTSSFGTHCSATGGSNGQNGNGTSDGNGGNGGAGSGTGAIAITGTPGNPGVGITGSTGDVSLLVGGNGGSSLLGAGGRAATGTGVATAGVRGGGSAGRSEPNSSSGTTNPGSVGYVVVVTYCLQ